MPSIFDSTASTSPDSGAELDQPRGPTDAELAHAGAGPHAAAVDLLKFVAAVGVDARGLGRRQDRLGQRVVGVLLAVGGGLEQFGAVDARSRARAW
jgi:hypothetical protein